MIVLEKVCFEIKCLCAKTNSYCSSLNFRMTFVESSSTPGFLSLVAVAMVPGEASFAELKIRHCDLQDKGRQRVGGISMWDFMISA